MTWANNNGMTSIPVLDNAAQDVWVYFERDFGIPTTVFLGPDMTVLSVDEMISSPAQFME